MGHWESYLAVSAETWNALTEEQRRTWDRIAREMALTNARHIDEVENVVRERARGAGTRFVPMQELPADMQQHLARAAARTWIRWIERLETDGHPARATALLWAELIRERGGAIPPGAAEYLGI
jgi:TRAP-type C4-dicarboxylate transport system substrate-binding protein